MKRSLEATVLNGVPYNCASLYYQLQTPADSEWIDRSSYNLQRIFPTSLSQNFYGKQLIPKDATLIVKKNFLTQK